MRTLVLGLICLARMAYAESPIAGTFGIGLRATSTSDSMYDMVYDNSSSVRFAAEGLVGVRLRPAVVGVHLGLATSLDFDSSPLADSGEQVATTKSALYPIDVGVGGQVEIGAGVWASAWIGATLTIARASSPAAHINAIDFTGDIPDKKWSNDSIGLGFGAAFGYDLVTNAPGSIAVTAAVERQTIGKIPVRSNSGGTYNEPQDLASLEVTFGMAYRY